MSSAELPALKMKSRLKYVSINSTSPAKQLPHNWGQSCSKKFQPRKSKKKNAIPLNVGYRGNLLSKHYYTVKSAIYNNAMDTSPVLLGNITKSSTDELAQLNMYFGGMAYGISQETSQINAQICMLKHTCTDFMSVGSF